MKNPHYRCLAHDLHTLRTMRKGIFYLNNTGSRWITLPKESHTFTTDTGETVTRKAIFYESFGNFATICISWKGKRIKVFADQKLPSSQEEVNQIHCNQFKKISHESE